MTEQDPEMKVAPSREETISSIQSQLQNLKRSIQQLNAGLKKKKARFFLALDF